MIDIEKIRQHPDDFRRAIRSKRIPLDLDRLLEVDQRRRVLLGTINQLRESRNRLSEAVAKKLDGKDAAIAESRAVGAQLAVSEKDLQELDNEYSRLMALVPGVPAPDVPEGETDADNVEIRRVGDLPGHDFEILNHIDLAERHKMVELDGARAIAGSRAYALTGEGALLEQAVLRFALDHVVAKGFIPVMPPLLVNTQAMFGTGYFPLGEENAYELERDTLFLTGTCEVGIVAMHVNRVFDAHELPLRFVGMTPCFRREAGAAGRDTKGFYRVHQFQKVEQIIFCARDPGVSEAEHALLLQNAEEILQALELPYRVVAVCTGDMGLGQVRKHDIETWMPSRGAYGETHSCSTFHEFQARRLNIRYTQEKKKYFAHTLNNTAIASPRILIPLLEVHQRADGSIYIPPALRPYLQGRERIG